ncbi:MAG: hypothetical protein V5A21_02465 [Halapricum sp.]
MSDMRWHRWAIVVFGPAALLIGLVALGYVALFLVPSGPCAGPGDLTAPAGDFAVASNGSAVFVIHVGNGTVGGETTDRVVVSVRNAESPDTASRQWIDGDGTIERGDTLRISRDEIGFELSDRDRVTVQWYGADPDLAEFCPNGRSYSALMVVRLENASTPIETSS